MGMAIGIIHGDQMDSLFVRSLYRLTRERDYVNGVIFVGGGAGRLDNARNEVATRFLGTGSQFLLTLDTDMVFTPEDVDRLYERTSSQEVRSGLYFVDERPPRVAAATVRDDGAIKSIDDWDDGAPVVVDYTGAGFMCVPRSVMAALPASPYRQDRFSPSGGVMGEDYAFCDRVREAGFQVKVDTAAFIGHIKTRVLGYE